MMEKILNFYITLIGWSWVSRGDSLFLRLFRKPLIKSIHTAYTTLDEKNYTLLYYWSLLYQYGKNVFYYKHTAENVRAGKQKFSIPKTNTIKNIYSNISLLKSFDDSALATLLQDINPKDIRLYIKNKKIIELFKWLMWHEISTMVKISNNQFIASIYKDIWAFLTQAIFISILQKELNERDIYHIKENIYNLDFWINKKFFESINYHNILLKDNYSDMVLIGIWSTTRETLFGLLLYLTYIREKSQTKKVSLYYDILAKIYIQDILHIDIYYHKKIIEILYDLQAEFNQILRHWIEIDDNKDYLHIWYENWLNFIGNKNKEDIQKSIISEDILRFKWFLKNISYYNKRFLMPQ
jgi:hypothetical protein